MLVCAHPAIAVGDRTPLMLNTVLGFTAAQVARSYAVPTRTMATRLVRAKHRIRDNRIPFRLPDRTQLPERMDAVLAAVYAAYVIEWSTGPGERNLPPEALHLAEVLAELAPGDPEVRGLAALVELSAARRPAREGADGRFVPLASQDTALWDADLVARAHDHLRAAHPARVVGRYQLEAAVQAVHCARRETGRTDWPTLLELHRSLAVVAPSLGSATALAAVTAEVEGPAAGLALLDEDAARTARFQPAWATRAELLARLGRPAEAAAAYDRAIALTHEAAERRHLEARRALLSS
jgi:RNA polymerase sigma-70 factor (ECF subfamily)